jgi:DNA-binding NarL/FixJ family response regulator
LILLDIALPLMNGIEAARQIRRVIPDARILFVTMQADRVYVEEAFRAGGAGYVVKQAASSELVVAIRTVLLGRAYVSPIITDKSGKPFAGQDDSPSEFFSLKLTPRQREVLQLVAEGKSMKEIASVLHISVRTVEFHKAGLMDQLGVRTTAELTRYALTHGVASTSTVSPSA